MDECQGACKHVCIDGCIYGWMCGCTHACMHRCICIYLSLCIYIYIYIIWYVIYIYIYIILIRTGLPRRLSSEAFNVLSVRPSAPAEPFENIWFCSRCRRKLKITIANNSGWATTLSKTHSKIVVFGANFNSAWEWHHFQEAGTVIRAGMVNNIFSYVLACPGGWAQKPLMWCPSVRACRALRKHVILFTLSEKTQNHYRK